MDFEGVLLHCWVWRNQSHPICLQFMTPTIVSCGTPVTVGELDLSYIKPALDCLTKSGIRLDLLVAILYWKH